MLGMVTEHGSQTRKILHEFIHCYFAQVPPSSSCQLTISENIELEASDFNLRRRVWLCPRYLNVSNNARALHIPILQSAICS